MIRAFRELRGYRAKSQRLLPGEISCYVLHGGPEEPQSYVLLGGIVYIQMKGRQ
jgi:hypothetical protein